MFMAATITLRALVLALLLMLDRPVGRCIVSVIVDRPAHIILPLVDLLVLLLSQVPAIGCAVCRRLVVDTRLALLQVARLMRSQLARPYTLGNPLLLVGSAVTLRNWMCRSIPLRHRVILIWRTSRHHLRVPAIYAGKL